MQISSKESRADAVSPAESISSISGSSSIGCCSVLQFAVACCNVLQGVASFCSGVAVCCSVLQFVAVCCSVLQYVAVCCSVLQCVVVCAAVCYSVLQMCSHPRSRSQQSEVPKEICIHKKETYKETYIPVNTKQRPVFINKKRMCTRKIKVHS